MKQWKISSREQVPFISSLEPDKAKELADYYFNALEDAAILEIIKHSDGKITCNVKDRQRKIIYQIKQLL